MSKSVVLTWDLPTTRKEGGVLALVDIADTGVFISLDQGGTFVPLLSVLSTDIQSVAAGDLVFGTYIFRFVVKDIAGLSSDPLDFSVDVPDESAPGTVMNVAVTFS